MHSRGFIKKHRILVTRNMYTQCLRCPQCLIAAAILSHTASVIWTILAIMSKNGTMICDYTQTWVDLFWSSPTCTNSSLCVSLPLAGGTQDAGQAMLRAVCIHHDTFHDSIRVIYFLGKLWAATQFCRVRKASAGLFRVCVYIFIYTCTPV